jgi:HAD superfamily hydrolase (TIGR01509 family)
LDHLLAGVRHLLFDFDGPVCGVFAGIPDFTIAQRLRDLLNAEGVVPPPQVARAADPFTVLSFATNYRHDLGLAVYAALRTAELDAVRTAAPTPGLEAVLDACRRSGRAAAVASNNSEQAVTAYLRAHGLAERFQAVTGRTDANFDQLKPHPRLVEDTVRAIGAQPAACMLIGDSPNDVHAAHAAGMACIGYATKPGKYDPLTRAGADAIIESLEDLAGHLADSAT